MRRWEPSRSWVLVDVQLWVGKGTWGAGGGGRVKDMLVSATASLILPLGDYSHTLTLWAGNIVVALTSGIVQSRRRARHMWEVFIG